MDAPKAFGGLGMSMVDQLVAWEELGTVTNALCWCFPEAQEWMFEACGNSDHQVKNYLETKKSQESTGLSIFFMVMMIILF